MADQHQHPSYQQYALGGASIALDVDKQHGQGQMSPPGANPGSIIYGASHASFSTASDPSYPHQHQQQHQNPHHPAYGHIGDALTLNPAQLRATAIGPSRVLTRRQARIAQAQTAHAYAANGRNSQEQQHFGDGFTLYPNSTSLSRPQTPNRFPPYPDQRVNLPDLNIGTLNMQHSSGMSPPHPSTPASVTSSSGFSHYGFHHPYASAHSHSHSRSGSSSTHPRSTSPAVSVVSAATSLSSGSGHQRPPLSSGSAGIASFQSTSKPKRRLLNKQRKEICLYYLEHPNSRQEDIAARWGVERSTVSKILKHKNRWLAVMDGDDQVIAKHRPSKFPEIEHELQDWLLGCRNVKSLISDVMIRTKAREAAKLLGIGEDKFKASAGWVENFKHRQGIKKGIWVGRPEPPIIPDDSDESDCEMLHEFRARVDREQALQAADEAARQAAAGIDVHGAAAATDLNLIPPAPLGDAKLDWPPPPAALGMGYGGPAVGSVTDQDGNSAPQLTGLDDEHRRQIALDCQPPPPYPSDGGVSSNDVGDAFITQGLTFGSQQQQQQQQQAHNAQAAQMQQFATANAVWGASPGAGGNGANSAPAVSAQEASTALEKVLRFLNTQRPGFLTQQEQNIITDIKHVIWLSRAESMGTNAATAQTTPNAVSAGTAGSATAGTTTAAS
ncbi:hypothetical protein M0805_004729 [Coniferiporia weirii]|nr:hypothetical protein M0805_004729 [Coniferiporia weirii]